jgi:excisionase family DNA binding protein
MTSSAAALDHDPIVASPEEAAEVAELHDLLEHRLTGEAPATLVSPDGARLQLPRSVYQVLVQVVHEMAQGHAVAVMPFHAQLTTQQAADLLGVSRPHLVKLLDDGKIAFTRPTKHRRVRLADLMAYKAQRDIERSDALDELAAEAHRLGLRRV